MKTGSSIANLQAVTLNAAMSEPFEIATGSKTEVNNVLVRIGLKDGTFGFGEGAPLPAFNGDDQAATLNAVLKQKDFLIGRDVLAWRALLQELDERLDGNQGAARAALEMAALDAWARCKKTPLRDRKSVV